MGRMLGLREMKLALMEMVLELQAMVLELKVWVQKLKGHKLKLMVGGLLWLLKERVHDLLLLLKECML
jgi:hypothetical protein